LARIPSCHATTKKENKNNNGKHLTIALAGNANVGKSVIFNQLTGSHQTIGNWPGKTVESAKGVLHFDGYEATIVDLPGIYSLSTFSLEELVTRDYIAREKPDVIIDVIGAPVLERNLFFTLQLMEMDVPLVVCLNQMDIAKGKGLIIDVGRLEGWLGVPVIPTIASRGKGVRELIEKAIEVARQKQESTDSKDKSSNNGEAGIKEKRGHHHHWHGARFVDGVEAHTEGNRGHHHRHRHGTRFGDRVEERVEELTRLIDSQQLNLDYPSRWVAIKLLEGDADVKQLVSSKSDNLIRASETLAKKMEEAYQEPGFAVLASERYLLANQIARDVQRQETAKPTLMDKLDRLATQRVFGYIVTFAVIGGLLLWTLTVGDFLSGLLSHAFSFFHPVDPQVSGATWSIVWNGMFGGLVAGITLVIPFVVPFYLMLAIMEDSGILSRVAFMMDSAMHQMGLHGKAIIPLILGYGCNVPAIYTTRIMGTRRERLLASFAITFAPCSARTIVILGLVAAFVGMGWALALYAVDLLIMFVAVKVALRVIPGEVPGLIMEMHSFRVPSSSVVAKQTWSRTKSLIYLVFPMYMVGTTIVQGLYAFGALEPINNSLSFLTVGWLGLPAIAGILLIFGAVRKELILLTLVAIYGTNLALVLTPAQLIVLALVGMLYLPCIATIGILVKEFSWKAAVAISAANLASAILIGGIAARVLALVS